MTVPKWPAGLPQYVLVEGFSYDFGDGRLRTRTDAGPGKMRRRFSAVARPVSAQIIVEMQEVAIFDDFWGIDTAGGALPFWLPNQIYLGLLVDPNGDPILSEPEPVKGQPWLVTFGDRAPVLTAIRGGVDGLHQISFSLSVMP